MLTFQNALLKITEMKINLTSHDNFKY